MLTCGGLEAGLWHWLLYKMIKKGESINKMQKYNSKHAAYLMNWHEVCLRMSVSVSPGGSTRGSMPNLRFFSSTTVPYYSLDSMLQVMAQNVEIMKRQRPAFKMSTQDDENGVSNDFTCVQTCQNPMVFWLQSPPTSMTPNPKRGYSAKYAVMTVGAAISNDTSAGCERKTAVMKIHTAFLPVLVPKTVEIECRVLYRVQRMVSDMILLQLKH